jgi:hypothetical protein
MDERKLIAESQKLFFLKRAEKWQEIEALKQEYKRNLKQIEDIEGRNLDVSFEVRKKLDWIQKESERIDQLMYENKLGEFED